MAALLRVGAIPPGESLTELQMATLQSYPGIILMGEQMNPKVTLSPTTLLFLGFAPLPLGVEGFCIK